MTLKVFCSTDTFFLTEQFYLQIKVLKPIDLTNINVTTSYKQICSLKDQGGIIVYSAIISSICSLFHCFFYYYSGLEQQIS